jgi:hypothetical protein
VKSIEAEKDRMRIRSFFFPLLSLSVRARLQWMRQGKLACFANELPFVQAEFPARRGTFKPLRGGSGFECLRFSSRRIDMAFKPELSVD